MRKLVKTAALGRWLGLCLVFLFTSLPMWAACEREESKELTFARVYCDYDRLIAGDSCVISYVVYATSPFKMVEKLSKVKVKNGEVRPWTLRRQHLQRVREQGAVYYALLVEEYVVKTKDVGKFVIAPRDYVVELSIEEYEDPFDAFFAPPSKVRKVKLKGESDRFVLNVVNKPMRTTKQMLRSGLDVI